jgi:hypothetical protein
MAIASKEVRRVVRLFVAVLIAAGGVLVGAQANAQPPRPPAEARVKALSAAEAQRRTAWAAEISRVAPPKRGCFKADYPSRTWVETVCLVPPQRPYPPRAGPQPQTVGNGTDYSAQTPGLLSGAYGQFENVSGVTGESSGGSANTFSLQVNSSFFVGPACPGPCQSWQQFVYSNSSGLFMQYWLINHGPGCPANWFTFPPHCYRNSSGSAAVPAIVINGPASLQQLRLTGTAVAGGTDTATLTVGGSAYATSENDNFVTLSQGWTTAEFNIFGDGNGSSADFNAGSGMNVRTAVNTGSITAPNCVLQGFTGETNNLTLVAAPAVVTGVAWPSILFSQSNAGAGPPSCATSNGDTHLTTFGGLYYDFQSQGDYILAERGTDFAVQARQVSGAPNWPNASVNKAVAVKLGSNRVAVSIEPERLVVNGVAKTLASGSSVSLPGGATVTHLGNVYLMRGAHGESAWVQLNSGYINVSVSLPRARLAGARGLLVNRGERSDSLMSRDGKVLQEPLSFADLYRYGESWRVRPAESLFGKGRGVVARNPDRPFHAWDLEPALYQRARGVCIETGVEAAWLDACTLDTAVLGTKEAARTFVGTLSPRHTLPLDRRPDRYPR